MVSASTIAENLYEKTGKSVSLPFGQDMIVTPKDIDELVSDLAEVISGALNTGLHSEDISALIQ